MVLKFNLIFHDSTPQKMFFQNIKIKLNLRTWMALNSPVVIFQALEPLQSQWPQQPHQPQWPQLPRQPHFIKTFTDPDAWIISSTKMINTCPFSQNRSSKIHIFTSIWYSFCWRLLRPANATFLKTGWWNTNGQPLWPCSQRYSTKTLNISTPQSHLL